MHTNHRNTIPTKHTNQATTPHRMHRKDWLRAQLLQQLAIEAAEAEAEDAAYIAQTLSSYANRRGI